MLKEDADVSGSGRHNGKTLIDLKCFRGEIELTAEFSEVLFPQSLERLQRPVIAHVYWQLTVKLNGRPEAQRARQSDSTLKAHQAPSHGEFHGPFQRLLERTHRAYCARAAFSRATRDDAVTK